MPAQIVNLSFIITNVKNKLTDLCGKCLLQNDFANTFCEMIFVYPSDGPASGPGQSGGIHLLFFPGNKLYNAHALICEVSRGEKMTLRETEPESYITVYTLVYADKTHLCSTFHCQK